LQHASQRPLDDSGALQHIVCRGIQRCRIYRDDSDRHDFLSRIKFESKVSNYLSVTIMGNRFGINELWGSVDLMRKAIGPPVKKA
jgi:hypothetical protein